VDEERKYGIISLYSKKYKKDQRDLGKGILRPVLALRCIISREAGRAF
jgi:hypothetical protein